MLKLKHKKAQSTLEYVVIFTVIIGIIIVAAAAKIKPAVTKNIDDAQTAIGNAADKLKEALPGPTPPTSCGGEGGVC